MAAKPRQAVSGKPELAVEWWDVGQPIPYAKNPRLPTKSAVAKVATSLQEFGWRQPIVVDVGGVIVAGHKRLLAAQSLKMDRVPVHVARDLTPAQAKAYRLMDNRAGEDSEWDLELLASEMGELQELEVDLKFTGFDQNEIDEYLANAALSPEEEILVPPVVPVAAVGDLWLLGRHRVLCGDCTTPANVERLLAGHEPFLMITDPPYGIELDSEWRDRAGLNGAHFHPRTEANKEAARNSKTSKAQPSYMKHRTEGHGETTISGDTRADWSQAFALVPTLQVAYVWHASKFTSEVLAGLLGIGFLHSQQIIWDKQRTVLTRTHYWFQHEPCWYVRKKNAPWFGKAGENSTIWACPSPKFIMGSDEDKFDHPTQKPIELMRRPLLNHTRRGESVYEPFLGSGTTLAAAEDTRRVCYGMELDPKFVDVVVKRWQDLTGKEATLDGDGRAFQAIARERVPAAAAD